MLDYVCTSYYNTITVDHINQPENWVYSSHVCLILIEHCGSNCAKLALLQTNGERFICARLEEERCDEETGFSSHPNTYRQLPTTKTYTMRLAKRYTAINIVLYTCVHRV